MRHDIKLYTKDGETIHLDYASKKEAFKIAKKMKKNNEVFIVSRIESDTNIIEIANDTDF